MKIKNYNNISEMISALTENFAELANINIEKNGYFSVALSGGNTPKILFANLAKLNLNWNKIFFFFGDERCVPLTSKDSNYYHAEKLLFSQIDIPKKNIFPIANSAEEYEKSLKEISGTEFIPSIDLIYLGMGDDGHTASLFPDTKGLNETNKLVIKVSAPLTAEPAVPRITMTYPIIKKGKNIQVLISGESKIDLLNKLIKNEKEVFSKYPILEITKLTQAEFYLTK